MHVGPEAPVIQMFERTIRQVDPDAPRDIIADAVEEAIELAKQRIARNQGENAELEAGIARLRSFSRRHRAGLKVVERST